MEKISAIVERYMNKNNNKSSLRGFADELNEKIENAISHVSIAHWLAGRNEPATDFLVLLILHYKDWRFNFALDCLAAKNPDVWGDPDGVIWETGREIEERKKNQSPVSIDLLQTKSS